MDSKELTERKKVISGKLGNLMKRIALSELNSNPKKYNFSLTISSHGNHISFSVDTSPTSTIENEEYYCLRWATGEEDAKYYNEVVAVIDRMESLFIKYSNLNK